MREREDDAEDGTASGRRAVADCASVRLDQRADNRQAKPNTSLAARARTVGACARSWKEVGSKLERGSESRARPDLAARLLSREVVAWQRLEDAACRSR